MKKFLLTIVTLGLFSASMLVAETISGKIEDIAEDYTYIVVDGTKIATTPEFVDEAVFDIGDKVEITVNDGKAEGFKYLFSSEDE